MNPSVSTIGITGASGMIGGCVTAALRNALPDVDLRILTRHPSQQQQHERLNVMIGDLMSDADCSEFVQGLDVIIHCAQSNSPAASDRHWPSDCTANFVTTLNLLDAVRSSGRKIHFIFASSGGAVYGDHPDAQIYHEDLACHPLSPYGIQKLAAEHYLRLSVAQGWLTACALRISNAYGAVLPLERRQGLIGVAVARHRAGMEVALFGSADTVRDYIHNDDIAAAFVSALDCRSGFSAMNLSSGVGHSVAEILNLIGEVSGRPVRVRATEFGGKQFALTPRMVLSNDKARATLNWRPQVQLRDGILRLWNASKQAPI